jgi:tetratricopeptide (TPR) repeat protein
VAVGSVTAMGWCELALGWVSLARGERDRAGEQFERAVGLGRKSVTKKPPPAPQAGGSLPQATLDASPLLLAHALAALAPLAAVAGDAERAEALAAEGVEVARFFGLSTFLLGTLTRATEVSLLFGRWASAEVALRESLALLRDTGSHAFLADSLEMAAVLADVNGGRVAAARLFGAAQRVRVTGGETADVRCISVALEQCQSRLAGSLADFDREFARGERLSPTEAVSYALENLNGEVQAPSRNAPGAVTKASLRQKEKRWLLSYGNGSFELPDMKGLHHLVRLLAEPGRELHALDLAGAPAEDAGPVLDERAKREYRQRMEELQAEIDEAAAWNDSERAARAQLELDALTRHLAAAVGLGSRDRTIGSSAERARVSVRKAIAKAIAQIAEHDADLGLLLSTTVKTGSYCSYTPDPRLPVEWSL